MASFPFVLSCIGLECAGLLQSQPAGLFDTSGFMPRWMCGDWSPELGWLHIISDFLIFVAYAAIPAALAIFAIRRRGVPLAPVLWLFVAFILSCGLTHLTDAMMFYQPAYRFLGMMKAITAVVSLATVIVLVRIMPGALALPELIASHGQMETELPRIRESEASLLRAREALESRTAALTVKERRVAAAMAGGGVAAVRWNAVSGAVTWELRAYALLMDERVDAGVMNHWSGVLDAGQLEMLLAASRESAALSTPLLLDFKLARGPSAGMNMRVTASAELVEPGAEPTMIGMFRVFA